MSLDHGINQPILERKKDFRLYLLAGSGHFGVKINRLSQILH